MISRTPWKRPSADCASVYFARLHLQVRWASVGSIAGKTVAAASIISVMAPRHWNTRRPSRKFNVTQLQRRYATRLSHSKEGTGHQAHIMTPCNMYKQETVILEKSAQRGGYKFHAVGIGSDWHGLSTKLAMYDDALKARMGTDIAPEDPVMLLDAWDTVVLGSAEEFCAKLSRMDAMKPGGYVIGAADRLCCPNMHLAPQMERLFPDVRTPFRYPNSGGFAGTCKALVHFLDCIVHGLDGGEFDINGDDQNRVQVFLASRTERGEPYPFKLDEECMIFKCMGEPEQAWDFELSDSSETDPSVLGTRPPRIVCHGSGERPIMAHGCGGHGRWFLADIYRELGLLDYLGVTESDLAGYEYAGLVAPGQRVLPEHWVNQAPWEWPFQNFEIQRGIALREEAEQAMDSESLDEADFDTPWKDSKPEEPEGRFFLVGSWGDWGELIELVPLDNSSKICRASVPVRPGTTVEFQILLDKDWSQRFFPSQEHTVGHRMPAIDGPADKHGANWQVNVPANKTTMLVTWISAGSKELVCEFS